MGRLTTAVAVACVGLHVIVLARGGAGMLAMTAPMLTLSALCLLCAVRARDHVEHLTMVATAVAMAGLHLLTGHDDPLMQAAVGLAGVQAVLALVGLRTGHRNATRAIRPFALDDARTPTEGIR
ncbi:hypothetical protein M1L60_43770 [Actinoplanes sp. TRM 88003]|uniref:Uncharacterized protein n=1 Tax=Paractinoplanes aksuensis TaxID=2939490 RepID=A0ABT1E321_9ACTN|nr:hypothetical protein [Actinoplanes aksuensis]MCO8277519.1 hypothetical protein [Actinoplanes aksuensis]